MEQATDATGFHLLGQGCKLKWDCPVRDASGWGGKVWDPLEGTAAAQLQLLLNRLTMANGLRQVASFHFLREVTYLDFCVESPVF